MWAHTSVLFGQESALPPGRHASPPPERGVARGGLRRNHHTIAVARNAAAAFFPTGAGPGATEAHIRHRNREYPGAQEAGKERADRRRNGPATRTAEDRQTGRRADGRTDATKQQSGGKPTGGGGPTRKAQERSREEAEKGQREAERQKGTSTDRRNASNPQQGSNPAAGPDNARHICRRRSPQRAYSDPGTRFGAADKIKFSTDTPVILQTINGGILKNVNYFSYFCINWKIMNLNAEVL